MKTTVRTAQDSDRQPILQFCTDTFSWGDYIDVAWDIWMKDRKGRLFIADSQSSESIAVGHAALCPYKESVWVEGVRVRQDHRKHGVASALIDAMLEFGRKRGASEALGIVASKNFASQRMMEKCGFQAVSDWAYLATDRQIARKKSEARLATVQDLDDVLNYLSASQLFRASGGRYMDTWRWYQLDKRALRSFVDRKRLLVTGRPITGVAVLNTEGYWDRKDLLQVVYLDSSSSESLAELLTFATNLYMLGGFRRLHVICHQSLAAAVHQFEMTESESFVLYRKKIESDAEQDRPSAKRSRSRPER